MKGENMKNKKQGIKPVTTGFDKMSKVLSYTLVYASIALGATACVNEEKKEEKQTESTIHVKRAAQRLLWQEQSRLITQTIK